MLSGYNVLHPHGGVPPFHHRPTCLTPSSRPIGDMHPCHTLLMSEVSLNWMWGRVLMSEVPLYSMRGRVLMSEVLLYTRLL